MPTEKLIYVPKNWSVSYVDETGNEHNNVALRADAEYRIVANGVEKIVTIAGITLVEDKTLIDAKIVLTDGYMNVIGATAERIDLDTITSIERVRSRYVRANRSNKDISVDENSKIFTFAFDNEKYPSKYRISIHANEFVALAVRDTRVNSTRTYYGHIVDVDGNTIIFCRYISNNGVREIRPEFKVNVGDLLGIYRYELNFEKFEEAPVKEEETSETNIEISAE